MQNVQQAGRLGAIIAASLFAATLLAPLAPSAVGADTEPATDTQGYHQIRIDALQLVEAVDSGEPADTLGAPPDPPGPTEIGADDLEPAVELVQGRGET